MPKILEINEGVKIIDVGMVNNDVDLVILPKSLKLIKANAIKLNNVNPNTFEYKGTLEEAMKIVIEEPNDVTCIKCSDNKVLIKKL